MQRLARAVPIAPHVTAYAVSILAGDPPRPAARAAARPRLRPLRRLAARRPGARDRRQDLRPARRPLQRLDRRHPRRGDALAAAPDHPQLRGRGRGHHDRGRRPRDPRRRRRRRRSNRRRGDDRAHRPRRRRPQPAACRRDAPARARSFLPSEVDPTVFDEAFLRQLERLLLLMRVAGPRRAEGRPAERQARPVASSSPTTATTPSATTSASSTGTSSPASRSCS